MGSHSAPARMRRHTAPAVPVRLLAETAVAVQYTLGVGDEEDNRALDDLERSVWLELARACPDRGEREYLIEQAHANVAPPGVPSCRHAIRLLVRAGGALLRWAGGVTGEERERAERCACVARARCGSSGSRSTPERAERVPRWPAAGFVCRRGAIRRAGRYLRVD